MQPGLRLKQQGAVPLDILGRLEPSWRLLGGIPCCSAALVCSGRHRWVSASHCSLESLRDQVHQYGYCSAAGGFGVFACFLFLWVLVFLVFFITRSIWVRNLTTCKNVWYRKWIFFFKLGLLRSWLELILFMGTMVSNF